MQAIVDPPLADWKPAAPPGGDRLGLRAMAWANAQRLGTPELPDAVGAPLIATGHQATLWHPGILAKDLAVRTAADRLKAAAVHVVVDHDVHDGLPLALPRTDGECLAVHRLDLAPRQIEIPVCCQPPAAVDRILTLLGAEHHPGALRLAEAFDHPPACRTLAEQVTVVHDRLRGQLDARLPVVFVTQLAASAPFVALVRRMLEDAAACVRAYNVAVAERPHAHVVPLRMEPDRVELPLWRLQWGRLRQRVFADLADSTPQLVLDDGTPVRLGEDLLAPRALLLSAFLRAEVCDLFVHGLGGGRYDLATETWWQHWADQPLAPKTVVTADLHLPFDAPVAEPADVARAVWHVHHLPHNLDRALGLDGELARRKRELLAGMDADRDRRRRAGAFAEIHRINDRLCREHPQPLAEARKQREQALLGLANRAIARKRDWCWALYDPKLLRGLAEAIAYNSRYET